MSSRLHDVILRGLAAARPAVGTVGPGTLYYSTDTSVLERMADDMSAWESYSAASGGVALHAPTHFAAGTDPVNITALAGFPGGTTNFLRADGTFAAPPTAAAVRRQITVIIDGGGSVITTGLKTFISLPVAGTLKKWRLLSIDAAVTAGSIVIDIWKAAYAGYPPVVGGTITAAAKPTLTAVNKNEDTALTGWTVAFAAEDILAFNVDSVATVTKVMLALEFE